MWQMAYLKQITGKRNTSNLCAIGIVSPILVPISMCILILKDIMLNPLLLLFCRQPQPLFRFRHIICSWLSVGVDFALWQQEIWGLSSLCLLSRSVLSSWQHGLSCTTITDSCVFLQHFFSGGGSCFFLQQPWRSVRSNCTSSTLGLSSFSLSAWWCELPSWEQEVLSFFALATIDGHLLAP